MKWNGAQIFSFDYLWNQFHWNEIFSSRESKTEWNYCCRFDVIHTLSYRTHNVCSFQFLSPLCPLGVYHSFQAFYSLNGFSALYTICDTLGCLGSCSRQTLVIYNYRQMHNFQYIFTILWHMVGETEQIDWRKIYGHSNQLHAYRTESMGL